LLIFLNTIEINKATTNEGNLIRFVVFNGILKTSTI
jgi:hypothetical protein